jgi:hypothetical protein
LDSLGQRRQSAITLAILTSFGGVAPILRRCRANVKARRANAHRSRTTVRQRVRFASLAMASLEREDLPVDR